MTNKDPHKFHHPSSSNDHVEPKQHPGEVHCLELGPKPKVHDGVLVQLAPHIEDAHDHRVHDEGDGHEECDDDSQHPVEEEHEEVVCRATIKDTRLQSQTVVVEEVEVDEEVKSSFRRQRVEEEAGDWSPHVEICDEGFPAENQPLGVEKGKPTKEGKENCETKPISGEDRKRLEPVLYV